MGPALNESCLVVAVAAVSKNGRRGRSKSATGGLSWPREDTRNPFADRSTDSDSTGRESFYYSGIGGRRFYRARLLMKLNGDHLRGDGGVRCLNIFNFCRTVFEVPTGFEISAWLKSKRAELDFVIGNAAALLLVAVGDNYKMGAGHLKPVLDFVAGRSRRGGQ